jgi:hypothetical protein
VAVLVVVVVLLLWPSSAPPPPPPLLLLFSGYSAVVKHVNKWTEFNYLHNFKSRSSLLLFKMFFFFLQVLPLVRGLLLTLSTASNLNVLHSQNCWYLHLMRYLHHSYFFFSLAVPLLIFSRTILSALAWWNILLLETSALVCALHNKEEENKWSSKSASLEDRHWINLLTRWGHIRWRFGNYKRQSFKPKT